MRDPEQIGPFRIIQRISSGGAGVTYLALVTDDSDDSSLLCCVKTPHAMWARDPAYMQAFKNEAQLASSLDHPNIVSLQTRSLDADNPYLVYPFIEGLDLGELIESHNRRGEPIDWTHVVTIARSVARALEEAHADRSDRIQPRPPIIHRDVCPPNIIIGLSGVVYLIDFGIARALEESSLRPSLHGSGRIAYAAPERLAHGRRYDERADLFSLGAVLFEALTGLPPYAPGSITSHIEQVTSGSARRVEEHRDEFAPDYGRAVPAGLVQLVNVVHRLLEPNPGHRFQSASEVVDALERIAVPTGGYRGLAADAAAHMPEWRRKVQVCTGRHPVIEIALAPEPSAQGDRWSSTDPMQLSHLDAQLEQRALERDAVHVDPQGAAQLLAQGAAHLLTNRYTPLVVQRPVLPASSPGPFEDDELATEPMPFDSTQPGHPPFELDVPQTEQRRSCAPTQVLIPPPFDDDSFIPQTRDGDPVFDDSFIPQTRDGDPVFADREPAPEQPSAPISSPPAVSPVSSVPCAAQPPPSSRVATNLPAYRLDPDGTLTPIQLDTSPPPPPRSRSSRLAWVLGAVALAAVVLPCGLLAVLTVMSTAAVVGGSTLAPQLGRVPGVGSGGGASTEVFSWLGPYPPVLVDVNGDGYRDAIGFTWDFDGDDAVTAVSGADASVLWVHEAEQELSGHFDDIRVWVPDASRVVFADRGGHAIGIDARTGAEQWRAPIGAQGTSACRIGNHLLITTSDQYVYRVAIADGAMERTRAPNPALCEHVPFVNENRRALSHKMPGWERRRPPDLPWPREQILGSWVSPTGDRYLVEVRHPGPLDRDIVEIAAVQPDGTILWQQPATEDWELASNRGLRHLAVEDGAVFVVYDMIRGRSDVPRRIAEFDYETGERVWDAPLEWQSHFDFLRADARRVYVGHWALEILDRADGRQIGRVGVFPSER